MTTGPVSTLGNCIKCGIGIRSDHSYGWCSKCGEPLPAALKAALGHGKPASVAADGGKSIGDGTPAVQRYRDAYRVATVLDGVGNAIKAIGAVVGFVGLLVVAVSGSGVIGSGSSFVLGVVVGGFFAGIFFVAGVVVSAHGQTLRASLDTAVYSSCFLTDSERAIAMGLSPSVVGTKARGLFQS